LFSDDQSAYIDAELLHAYVYLVFSHIIMHVNDAPLDVISFSLKFPGYLQITIHRRVPPCFRDHKSGAHIDSNSFFYKLALVTGARCISVLVGVIYF